MDKFSIILPAYNEGKKPIKLIRDIENQNLPEGFFLEKVVFIVSGKDFSYSEEIEDFDLDVKYIKEPEREGKASAINKGLRYVETKYVVLMSSDIRLSDDRFFCEVFSEIKEDDTGVVTVRPKPFSDDNDFISFLKNLVWGIHHHISKRSPKAGETMAFINVFDSMPKDIAADEEYIKSRVEDDGYETSYSDQTIVYNKGPKSLDKLLDQRMRVFVGHLDLVKRRKYMASSMIPKVLFFSFIDYIREKGFSKYLPLALIFESYARCLGFLKYTLFNYNPYVWNKVE